MSERALFETRNSAVDSHSVVATICLPHLLFTGSFFSLCRVDLMLKDVEFADGNPPKSAKETFTPNFLKQQQ